MDYYKEMSISAGIIWIDIWDGKDKGVQVRSIMSGVSGVRYGLQISHAMSAPEGVWEYGTSGSRSINACLELDG